MKLRVKDMDIATGGIQVVIINKDDAQLLDLHSEDRLLVKKGRRSTTGVLDIAESHKFIASGQIGMFEETLDALGAKDGDIVDIALGDKPKSVAFIKKKLDGLELSAAEIRQIIDDITDNQLSQVELTSYVMGNYANGMSMREIVDLTKAMASTGDRLRPKAGMVADIHCIGGVPGNRTTMIVVPIMVAAGLTVPKTASRAITSPAGTADTMEVLCSVSLPKQKLERMLTDVGGFIVWGGAINLAPSDDKIIRIEYPLSIDAEGQMLASIMAKKATVGATHLLMDLPVGPASKLAHKRDARHLQAHFEELGRILGIKMRVVITNGSEPIGSGIGPALEARDCLYILEDDARGPADLRHKSLNLAGKMLEFTGKAKPGKGFAMAVYLLRSGKAHDAMMRIIVAQGGKRVRGDDIGVGKLTYVLRAQKAGRVIKIDNMAVARIARIAGAPKDKKAGIYLHVHKHAAVKQGDPLITIHANNPDKLKYASEEAARRDGVIVR